jgi:hypothetical protein
MKAVNVFTRPEIEAEVPVRDTRGGFPFLPRVA